MQSGTWTVANDELAQTATGTDRRIYDSSIVDADIVVETRFTFDGFEANDDRNAGAMVRLDPAAGDGWLGGVFLERAGTMGAHKLWILSSGTAGMFSEVALAPPTIGTSYVLTIAGVDATVTTWVDDGVQLERNDPLDIAGYAGLRAHRALATYDYFVVYRVAGPLP